MDSSSANDRKQLGRRGALLGIGAAAGVAADGLAGLARADGRHPDGADPRAEEPELLHRPDAARAHGLAPADDAVRALFGGLTTGSQLGRWRIEAVHAVRAGAIPVVMSTAGGERFALEVFRSASGEPEPIGRAGDACSLYLSNRGHGGQATREEHGLGVRALAAALARRLETGAPVPAELSTHAARRRAHPFGVFHIPTDRA